jgi:LuxR family maltose regulon positive regulatory protein
MIRSVVERTPAAFIADLLVRTTTSWTTSPEQVLARQSKDVRHFLLETSILESLTGPLCDAVTGRDGGKANA